MKSLIIAGMWLGLGVSALAQNTDPVTTPATPVAAAPPAAMPVASPPQKTDKTALNDRNCLRHTGSRLVGKGQCANASGRAYTRDDLQRSGRTDLADALRALDPSVR